MKQNLKICVMLCGMALATAATASANNWKPDDKLMKAISFVESTGGLHLVGDAGASLGEFQMSHAAWEDVNAWRKERRLKTYPFSQFAFHAYINRVYASNYLTIIHSHLKRQLNRQPTVEELYASYNMGLTRFGAECGYDLTKVNKVTARKAATIREMVSRKN